MGQVEVEETNMNWHLISAIRFAVLAHKNQKRGGPKDIPTSITVWR